MTKADYRRKINNINSANGDVNKAITNYEEALTELAKIKNIKKCEEFASNIETKITNLKAVLKTMDSEIRECERQIRLIEEAEAAAAAAAAAKASQAEPQ